MSPLPAPIPKRRRPAALALALTLAVPTLAASAWAGAPGAASTPAAPATPATPAAPAGFEAGAEAPERAMAAGRYAQAAAGYRARIEAEGYSAADLAGLGAALVGSRELGEAILSFERARYLAPASPAVEEGLEATRVAAGLPDEARPAWWKLARLLPVGAWSYLAAAALWASAFILLAAMLSRRGRRPARLLAAAGAGLALTSGAAAAASFAHFDRAIVLDPLPVALSPFEGSESVFSLQEGAKVRVLDRRGEYVFVRAEGGGTGWLPGGRVEPIVPAG